MRASIQAWQVEEIGPAPSTRRVESDGSVTYEAISDITLRIRVIGNDAGKFISDVTNLTAGTELQGLKIVGPVSVSEKSKARSYHFE